MSGVKLVGVVNVLKRIFLDHWERFKTAHPRYSTAYYDRVVRKMLTCGDPSAGWAQFLCTRCGETRKVPFSCKSSFCLSCAKGYVDEWVEFISQRLFPGVSYRHVILTIPEALRGVFYEEPKRLAVLMKAAHACLTEMVAWQLKRGVEIGTIVVLQTTGRSGSYNPHVHVIMTSGGLDAKGEWRRVGFLDFNVLHRKWQHHLLTALKEAGVGREGSKVMEECRTKYPKGWHAHVQNGEVPPGGSGLARYLATYVVSPPISLRRIVEYDGEGVEYWYNDHVTEARKQDRVDALKFIGLMIQHVLPKGFQRIRYYGLHATCKHAQVRSHLQSALCRDAAPAGGGYRVRARKDYRQRMLFAFGVDPMQCPKCGQEMDLLAMWHPKYGRFLDRWDEIFQEVKDETDAVGSRDAGPGRDPMVQLCLSFMPTS